MDPLPGSQESQSNRPYLPRSSHFDHAGKLAKGKAHILTWNAVKPCQSHTCIMFIPGNPGLLEFYTPFLSSLYEKADKSLTILAHGHIGHSPSLPPPDSESSIVLEAQLEACLEFFAFIQQTYDKGTKIVLIGHSVGAWIATQVNDFLEFVECEKLKLVFEKVLKQHPTDVAALFLLTPILSNLATTPNGRRFSWLFQPPVPRILASISNVARFIPTGVLSWVFRGWPSNQILALKAFITSPGIIFAALTMARTEMESIRDLDVELLQFQQAKIWIFFSQFDDWVGGEEIAISGHLLAGAADSSKVIQCRNGVPHSFCINHGTEMAATCVQWLQAVGTF